MLLAVMQSSFDAHGLWLRPKAALSYRCFRQRNKQCTMRRMNHRIRIATVLAVSGLVLTACSRKPDASAVSGKLSGQNLLLITLDTTRADRLGCYGYKPAATPTLDALAVRGTLFENAFAQVPLTLPSHSSILTGRYPREHGVRDNGRNALGKDFPTLATLAKEHGYQTAAFVASFVLDSRFGLERGFDTYNDDMGNVNFETQPLEWQQPANVVTDRALQWLESSKRGPFFCWIHYYDPHQPYLPPVNFRQSGVLPYDGEIAFVDTQVKRVTDWLSAAGLAERTLVIVIGDHGEAFGEHGEEGHSENVYHVNVHIPLFFAHPSAVQGGKRVTAVVESVDVFPTILDLFGWKGPANLMSRSLAMGLAGRPVESVGAYSESLFLFNAMGWAEQRSITTDRWKYLSSSKPGLFDRQSDPGETKNLIADEPRTAARLLEVLKDRYDAMTPGQAAVAQLDPEALSAIRGLGYAGGATQFTDEFLTTGLPDPKDMQDVLVQFKAANALLEKHDRPEDVALVIPLAQHMVERSPNSHILHRTLGTCYLRAKQPADALESLKTAIDLDPGQTAALALRGDALAELKRYDEAIEHYRAALKVDPNSVGLLVGMGNVLYGAGRIEEAVENYKKALELFPTHVPTHNHLAIALTALGKVEEANVHYREAVKLRPENPEFHYNLGLGLINAKQYSEAAAQLQEAVRLKPNHRDALLKLGMAQLALEAVPAAKEAFTQAAAIPESAAEACYQLGVILAKDGNLQEAVEMYEKAVAAKPSYTPSILELSQIYLTHGYSADAVRILRIGAAHVPDNVRILERLARVLAVSRYDDVRDGATAVTLAERASKLSGGQEPIVEATLAAACAESGDFRRAIEIARKALQLAENAKMEDIASVIQSQIERYLNNQTFREQLF